MANYYDKYSPFENISVVATEASIIFELNPTANNDVLQIPLAEFTPKSSGPSPFIPLKMGQAPGDKNAIKFRGFIDRLDKEGENFVINDYKTNKNLPPESKEEYKEQLTLYGL